MYLCSRKINNNNSALRITDKRQYMKNNMITSAEVKLNGGIDGITWVLVNPVARVFKYQEIHLYKAGFKRTERAGGVLIYAKYYGTRKAALNDKESLKRAITQFQLRNSGKKVGLIGNVICDEQYAQGTYEEPFNGWSSDGSVTFNEIMK